MRGEFMAAATIRYDTRPPFPGMKPPPGRLSALRSGVEATPREALSTILGHESIPGKEGGIPGAGVGIFSSRRRFGDRLRESPSPVSERDHHWRNR